MSSSGIKLADFGCARVLVTGLRIILVVSWERFEVYLEITFVFEKKCVTEGERGKYAQVGV